MAVRALQVVPAQVDLEQPPQLRDRLLVIVDAQVDDAVHELAGLLAGARPLDVDGGRLLPPHVAAGVLPRLERGDEPLRQRARTLPERPHHLGHDRLAREDVALGRDARAGLVPRPRVALDSRPGGRAAVRRDHSELARLACLVVAEHDADRLVGRRARLQQVEELRAVAGDSGRLGRHGADTRASPGDDRADCEVLGLDGDTELARLRVDGADREGRRPPQRHARDPTLGAAFASRCFRA